MVWYRRPELYAACNLRLQKPPPPSSMLVAAAFCLLSASGLLAQSAPPKPSPIPEPVTDQTPFVPGVNPDQDHDGLLSVHGLPSTQTGALLDGVDVSQTFHAIPPGAGSDPAPDPDGDPDSTEVSTGPSSGSGRGRRAGVASGFARSAIRELRVAAPGDLAGYSAQAGHLGGAVESSSRSGTESYHGIATYRLRSSVFAATDPLAIATSYANGLVTSQTVKPSDLRQDEGVSFAGPVPRASGLVFLYAFEGQHRGFPAVSSPSDPNFFRLTATQTALLGNRGVTPAATAAGLTYLSSLTGSAARSSDNTIHFGKLDWSPRAALHLGLQYNRVRWNSPSGLIDAPVVARGRASIGSASGSLDQLLTRLESRRGRRIRNTLTLHLLHDLQFETPQPNLPQEPAIGPGGQAPEVVIGPDGILFGTPANASTGALPDEWRFGASDTASITTARHQLTLGASFSQTHDRTATLRNAAGTFSYDSGTSAGRAGGLVDFLTDYTFNVNTLPNGGCPAITAVNHAFCFRSFSQSFGEQTSAFSMQDWAAFVEDRWQPRKGLTLQAGLRYEYTLLPLPQRPNASLDAIFGARGATSIFPEDRNNLGPRLSAAWEPLGSGRGIVRLGGGLFYGRLPSATVQAAMFDTAQMSSTTRVRFTPITSVPCPQAPANGFGYPCSFLQPPQGVVATTASAVVFDRRFRLPAVAQGSVSVERTVGRETVISLGYAVNIDRQLATSTDINIAPSTQSRVFQLQGGTGVPGVRDGETFTLPLYASRISPTFGPVSDIRSSVNGSYHALVATLSSKPVHSLQIRANYTWSKAIDDGPNLSATPRTNGQLDPFANGYDKGLSSLNYPWASQVTAHWTPRAVSSGKLLQRPSGGWSLAPYLVARAGRPYSYDLSGGSRLNGGHESLNGSGGALYLPTVGRNTLRLPATIRVDMAASRSFVYRGIRGRVGAEAFNLLNHRQVSSVSRRAYLLGTAVAGVTPLVFQSAAAIAAEGLTTRAFGVANGAGSSVSRERQVEVFGRLEF